MADSQRVGLAERDIDQAITALKKGAYLLKYGRRGKPKFCPFRLSNDESMLIWYYGKEEKQLELCQISRIFPGQCTAIFQRYPRPEKEYQSFSLIYKDRSLDLICKDKDEAEVWFVGLKALISRDSHRKLRSEAKINTVSSNRSHAQGSSPSNASFDQGNIQQTESLTKSSFGKAFSDRISYTAANKSYAQAESVANSLSSVSSVVADKGDGRSSASETIRFSLSSAVSSSSQGSCREDFDALGDVFIWGEGIGDGVLGGGLRRVGSSSSTTMDALLPKALESTMLLDVQNIACGGRHAVLVTKQGEIFSWGEESGGRLGHGVEEDACYPKLINTLSGMNIELVACGEYHTCAVTFSGDLYTWGDGSHNSGLLGHGSEASHWIPKKVSGPMEGIHVSNISCGPWHTALVTSAGQLFTFGDGTFGALGHGDCSSTSVPREVENLKGLRTMRVACGVWHTAAVVEVMIRSSSSRPSDGSSFGNLFTWGDGDKGQLGHGDKAPRLIPEYIAALVDVSFCKVACGHNLTIALTTSGRVYTMGSTIHGQLGSPSADGNIPSCVEGEVAKRFVEEISCGSYHVAVVTSKTEVYTWGKGANGQLGHGDNNDRDNPTLIEFLKDKQVKSVVCGSNFTAVICLHKRVSSADNSVCFGCHNPFNFRRKRHNCYNCGLLFCNACSNRKSLIASLAPCMNKPYRVCDDCFTKLKKAMESGSVGRIPKVRNGSIPHKSNEVSENMTGGPRSLGQISRLLFADSFNLAEGENPKHSVKVELNDSRVFPLSNGNIQRGNISLSTASTALAGALKSFFPASLPGSRIVSRATSPILGKACSSLSATPTPSLTVPTTEVILDDSKHKNEILNQDVRNLRAQVEDLSSKSLFLEAELERTSRQLKEATELAADEAEKCKAAKDVIKSLTAQLKEMSERVPEVHVASSKLDSITGHVLSNPNPSSYESNMTGLISLKSKSSDLTTNSFSYNGTKSPTEKAERVVQDDPGVYVTLSSLPGGGNELRRVRFSRKRFTEEQAEKWWAQNRD
ncbi:hypothetical protein F0562_032892 [Nyssa sinensis]|uniref:FYVE-type domain-containing protein n=1 Tax=Nyssa sinensis TaxID=561372 RepID=A0A5J5AVG3_9ASTE|nr:hypothetical protein F0562_032892 [Nyssa sinensis]